MVRITRKQDNGRRDLLKKGFLCVATFVVVSGILRLARDAQTPQPTLLTSALTKQAVLLENEAFFRSTIKSCLPSEKGEKCKTYIAPDNGNVERIAFIAPPGDVSERMLKVVQTIASQYNEKQQGQLQVIGTTHVPPYGYGKTHGYTKIIRMKPQSLALDAADASLAIAKENWLAHGDGSSHQTTSNDLQALLRQILRYHCRLSHVAAHTALLTLEMDDLTTNPDQVLDRLVEFLIPQQQKDSFDLGDAKHLMDRQNLISLFESVRLRSLKLFSSAATSYPDLNQVLLDELALTKNMTAWPCPSFWAATSSEAAGAAAPPPLSPVARQLAQALSPNCTDPMARCFVPRDKCEAAGDAICKK